MSELNGMAQQTPPSGRRTIVRRRRKRSLFEDPMVRMLSLVLIGVIIIFLSTILAALYLGILGSDVPKTALQRDLQAYEFQTSQGSQDPEVWKLYVDTLVNAGRLRTAQDVVDRGMKIIDDTKAADMTFAQTQVHYSSKDYDDAIESATEGMAIVKAYYEKQKNTDGTPEQKGQPMSENYWGLLYLRARSYADSGDHEKALIDYSDYLAEKKGASDVYVLRAATKLELGDKEGAIADYRSALKFLPDYEPAIDGLKKLGAE